MQVALKQPPASLTIKLTIMNYNNKASMSGTICFIYSMQVWEAAVV